MQKIKGILRDYEIINSPATPKNIVVGGEHYKKYGDFQPWDAWVLWDLNPFQANILRYVVRYRDKHGIEDLRKARHMLDKLIEVEMNKDSNHDTSNTEKI